LDGSVPSLTNGMRVRDSIPITTTTAMADSELESRTYLFVEDILRQTGADFPKSWGKQDDWTAPAHYTMSPEIVNDPAYRDRIRQGLKTLPSVSIITEQANLFDPD